VNDHAKGRESSATALLLRGVAVLTEVLGPAGFELVQTEDEVTTGGAFASGEFLRGDRRLELQVRSSLTLVRYHFGEKSLSHEDLVGGVRALDAVSEAGQYPGFSSRRNRCGRG